ncbi:MAG: sensor histidine kinase [Candidatus Delongbacteria bacterium]|nr:sensor histidine kinase [Candidatus Delongbacteria bacterium]
MMKEISLHILDLLENSTKAGATRVEMIIRTDTRLDRLSIEIRDNGHGIPAEKLNHVFDPFYTTRTTRRIGLGLPLIKQTVEACRGEIRLQSVLGQGTCLSFWMQNSHLDRPPMGNLVDTIMSFISGNKNVDFFYEHYYNDHKFLFNTLELKAQLDDLAMMDNPEVYSFIRTYLMDNLKQLPGGNEDEVFS